MQTEGTAPIIGLERGHQASAAVRHVQVRALLAMRARATFRPIKDHEIAPVLPCDICHDGGLRVVGRVRGRGCWQRVHVCDTCGALKMYELPASLAS